MYITHKPPPLLTITLACYTCLYIVCSTLATRWKTSFSISSPLKTHHLSYSIYNGINAWNISFQNSLRWFIDLYHILDDDQLVSLFIPELNVCVELSSASFNKYCKLMCWVFFDTLPYWGFVFSHLQGSRFEGHWVPLSASNWWYSNEIWSRCTCLEVLWTGLTGGQTGKQQVWWGRCFGFVGKGTLGVNLFYLPLHV